MRKPTKKLLDRQRRLHIYWLRRQRLIAIASRRRRRQRLVNKRPKQYGVLAIPVPTHLRYHGSDYTRQVFVQFADSVSCALRSGRRVRLDFSTTQILFPCGMLLFLGWLDSWLSDHPVQLTAKYPEDDIVEQMLQSANVLQRLGLSARKEITHNDVVRWHQFQGENVDATPIEPFMLQVRDATSLEWQMGLADCVAEALTNVKKHAYLLGRPAHWWMFATIDADAKRIFVAMHDRGESIPGTLLAKPEWFDVALARQLRKGGDCELICAALGGRTRTRLYYRGKGLPEMLEFTSQHSANALAIYSRHGYFVSQKAGQVETKGTLKHPVDGTLVIWTLNYSGEKS